jgi:hypothetical protein
MIKTLWKKYYILIAAVVCSITFGIYFFSVHSIGDNYEVYDSFERDLHAKQDLIDDELDYFKKNYRYENVETIWQKLKENSAVNLHVYRNDSLLYWNTNQLPILRFADIRFPSSGILDLQNGWYCAKTIQVGDYVVCGSFLIKQDYSYQNSELINDFAPDFS